MNVVVFWTQQKRTRPGRSSRDLKGAHEGAGAASGRDVRLRGRSRDRSTAGTWQRLQIHAGDPERGDASRATSFPGGGGPRGGAASGRRARGRVVQEGTVPDPGGAE